MVLKIYIASSWKNQHAVEMLTTILRTEGHNVVSWIENNYGENNIEGFEDWMKTEKANQSFEFDTHGAMNCDLLIYVGPSGKDAAAECGMCYGQRLAGKTIPMFALHAKGEDFGLMRKMFDYWFDRYTDVVDAVKVLTEEVL